MIKAGLMNKLAGMQLQLFTIWLFAPLILEIHEINLIAGIKLFLNSASPVFYMIAGLIAGFISVNH